MSHDRQASQKFELQLILVFFKQILANCKKKNSRKLKCISGQKIFNFLSKNKPWTLKLALIARPIYKGLSSKWRILQKYETNTEIGTFFDVILEFFSLKPIAMA